VFSVDGKASALSYVSVLDKKYEFILAGKGGRIKMAVV
jgi:hypothetical protein